MTQLSHEVLSPEIELFRGTAPLPGQTGLFGLDVVPPAMPDVPINLSLGLNEEPGEKRRGLKRDVFADVRIDELNAIAQARDEYEGIDTLAGAIEDAEMVIHNVLAARFDEFSARRYLNFVNGIYGDKLDKRTKFEELVPSQHDGKEVYYIVIAGHRRIRAVKLLGEESLTVKVLDNKDALDALFLQAQENTGKVLKDYERAEQHGRLWAVAKVREPKLSRKEFAKSVGATEAIVQRDLRYYSLPDEVKRYVVPRNRTEGDNNNTLVPEQPLMAFNVACQLGRLTEAGAKKEDILFLARRFFEENITSERAASERVTRYIANTIRSGDQDMADIFGTTQKRLDQHRRKKEAAERFAAPIDNATAYFSRVVQSHQMGLSNVGEDGVSFAASATRFVNFVNVMEGLLPLMRESVGPEVIEHAASVLQEVREVSSMAETTVSPSESQVLVEGKIISIKS